ncbi:MAG TPA: AzlD domain-containing protein [Herpetosiphonaceae bacterium]
MSLLLTLVAIGLITFGQRFAFIALQGRWAPPDWLTRALRFVPVAVLSAIIVPDLVLRDNALDLSPTNPRLICGLVAGLVAWRTKNVLLTIGAGLAVFFAMQWALG